jgi:hypothetical protein
MSKKETEAGEGELESCVEHHPITGLIKQIFDNAHDAVIKTVSEYDAEELKAELISWLKGIKTDWMKAKKKKESS